MGIRKWFGQGASRVQRRSYRLPRRLMLEMLEPRQLLSVNVLTWHNDLTRQGLNSAETALTPANVNSSSFGKLFTYSVAAPVSGGGQIFAEPLYVSNLAIPGQGTHNVVFVATENNDVYAFDADSNAGPNGGLLWHVNLGPYAVTPPPNNAFGSRYGPYSDIRPQVGITSTPVIDLANGTMYLDSFTNDGVGLYSHHIWALDITTGVQKTSPTLVAAAVQGNAVDNASGIVNFKASQELQRSALTLLDGTLYVAYAGYADTDPYHGWVLGFNASTLQLTRVLNTTPNHPNPADPFQSEEGGIWQSGNGFSSDGTLLYVMTGNGDFQTSVGDYGDSFLEITPDSSTQATGNLNGNGLSITDYFTPFNEQNLAQNDTDLGSGGTMILPDQPGAHPHLLIGSGKGGTIYVIDRDNMGQFNASSDKVVQKVSLNGHGTWSSAAYFNNMIYEHAMGDVLKAFSVTNGVLSAAPIGIGATTYSFPGATPSVSSNGTANGIVWDVQYDATHAVLRAYSATPSGTTLTALYNSNSNVARDQLGAGVKFVTPMIANGKVYVGTTGGLAVFGLLSPPNAAPAAPSNLTTSIPAALQVKLNWTDNATSEQWFKIERSTDGVNFTQIDVASANATSYTDTAVVPGIGYTYRVRAANTAGDSAYSGTATGTAITVSTPIDLYHFDEGVGATAFDSIGSNNGTLVGSSTPAWIAGRIGAGALSFSGNGQFNQSNQSAVQVVNNLANILGFTSTLDVWVKTTQTGSDTHYQAPAITGVDQAGNGTDINWGTLNASGRIGIFVGDAGGVYSTNPINDGQWHNVAMTRDSVTGIVQLFVDGMLNGTGAFDMGSKASQFFLIGALSNVSGTTLQGANYFNGQLDEVRIYNRVLTATEIAEIGQIPDVPASLSATPYSGSIIQLSWTNVSNFAQNVEVQRKVGAAGTYQQIAILSGAANHYDDSGLEAGTQYYYRVRAIDLAGNSAFSNEVSATPPRPQVVGRFTFYNQSNWDGQNGSSNVADNLAIATDKQALLPGQTASFQNYTSYSKGMNGIIVDLSNYENSITPNDFTLLVGNSPDINTWQPAPEPTFISLFPGFGIGGSNRFEILWDNNEIENEWVQVTLKANAVTKLAAPDVFYFGNAIGDSGNSATDAVVDSADELAARNNGSDLGVAAITNPYDYNRDKHVDVADQLIARSHAGAVLQLITVPTSGAGAGAISIVADASTPTPLGNVVASSAADSNRRAHADSALATFGLRPGTANSRPTTWLTTTQPSARRFSLIEAALLEVTSQPPRPIVSGRMDHLDAEHHLAMDTGRDASPPSGAVGHDQDLEANWVDDCMDRGAT